MAHALDTASLHALYAAGHTIVLPKPHAARALGARFRTTPLPPDENIPEPKAPLAWQDWTATLWSGLILEGRDDRILLNRLQEEQIWAEILTAQMPAANLASLRDLASLARSGLQRAAAHRVLDRLRSEADSPDSRVFAAAVDLFRAHCTRHRLLPSALLEEALASHLGSGTLAVPEVLHLVGFEQQTPAQRLLQTALERAGTDVQHSSVQVAHSPSPNRISCVLPGRLEELRFAVRHIAQQAHAGHSTPPSIAFVCLSGNDDRPELERLFRELLAPELESIHADLSSTPWHFVTQPPLRSAPLIAAALDILQWTVAPLPLERIGQLLLSPFFTHTDPIDNRARFEARTLRRSPILRPALDLVTFLPLLRTQSAAHKDRQVDFSELRTLSRAAEHGDLATATRSHAHWADAIRRLLLTVGWPGPRALSPAEFRTLGAWESLLDLLSTLQFQGQRTTFSNFLELLTAEAGTSQPSPAGKTGAPVQVLALQETEGQSFDLSIVVDASDKHLPLIERRHTLLPQELQRSLGFGEPAPSLTQTRAALDNLARRSALTLLLAPANEDDSPAQLTPLAAQLAFHPVDPASLLPDEALCAPLLMDSAPEADNLPFLRDVEVIGGAEVLRLQAACGFRAFASLRLAAGEPQSRDLGLNALDTGQLLHAALELFWAGVRSQAALRALSLEARRDLVSEAVGAAVARLRPYPQGGDGWSKHFLEVLKTRFTNLLLRWLELELQRSPFTVLAQEQQGTLTLGPLRLKLRPDRIDQVEGGLVLVDYKSTYDLSLDHWTDSRPDAPQLPAYALCADPDQLQGIAFAQIRPDRKKLGWISLSRQTGTFPKARGKQVDLRDQVERWRDELTTLAEAFAAGDTRVDPKSYPQTCTYCAHRALCRLDPTTLLEQAELDDELTEEEELRG